MPIDSRFLDDAQIIKRDVDAVPATSTVIVEEPPEQEPPKPKRVARSSRKRPAATDIGATAGTSEEPRVQILREMIDKAERQLVAKQVDVRVYQRMFNNASSNEERRRFEATYQSAMADIQVVKLKLQVMNDLLVEWG